MQVNMNDDGSGCIHKITGDYKGNASAYFGPGAVLVDAEVFPRGSFTSGRSVKRGGPMWDHLEKTGKTIFARMQASQNA